VVAIERDCLTSDDQVLTNKATQIAKHGAQVCGCVCLTHLVPEEIDESLARMWPSRDGEIIEERLGLRRNEAAKSTTAGENLGRSQERET
jgi:hypothetical protein